MLTRTKYAVFFALIVAVYFVTPSLAIKVTELAGAAHGYPGLCDSNGKKLADAEFRQWVEDDHLYVVITYRFPDGRVLEEKTRFRLKSVGFDPFPTVNRKVVTVTVSYAGLEHSRMGGHWLKGHEFIIHPEIPFSAKLFVKVPDTKIWLTNPAPPGSLRWEGPIVLPTDPLIRVDLLSAAKSGPAQ